MSLLMSLLPAPPLRPVRLSRTIARLSLIVVAGLLTAACGSATATPSNEVGNEGTKLEVDPAKFINPTLNTNRFHPLRPGTRWVYGDPDRVDEWDPHVEVVATVTDVIRVIDGIPTVAVLNQTSNHGSLAHVGVEYLALDRYANVWLFGGYREEFDDGEFVTIETAWLGTSMGEQVGIISPGDVTMDTPRWFVSQLVDGPPLVAEPFEVGASVCIATGCFDDVRIVAEREVGATQHELKHYAPGIGLINNTRAGNASQQDSFELVSFEVLPIGALDAASQLVLNLELHAHETAAHVFGFTVESTRDNQ